MIPGITKPVEWPTYYAVWERLTVSQGYVATMFNSGVSHKAVIRAIWAPNWQTGPANVYVLDHALRRISARTIGTAVPIVPMDTADLDPTSVGIRADTLSTAVTEVSLIKRFTNSSQKLDAASTSVILFRALDPLALVYEHLPGERPLTLRTNEGVTIRNTSGDATLPGTISFVFKFTVEPL